MGIYVIIIWAHIIWVIWLTYSDMSSRVGHIWQIDDCQLDHLIGGEEGGALVEELSNSPNFLSLFHGQEPVSSLHRNQSSPHHFFQIQKFKFWPFFSLISGRKWPKMALWFCIRPEFVHEWPNRYLAIEIWFQTTMKLIEM